MQPLEHKVPSLPLPQPEVESISRSGKKTWSQVQAPTPNPATTSLYATKPTKTSPTKHQTHSQEIPRTQNKCHRQKKKDMIAKRRYTVRVLSQPAPSTPASTAPTHMVTAVSTQTPVVRSTAESILLTIHKLAMG